MTPSFKALCNDNSHGASYLYEAFLKSLLKKTKTRRTILTQSHQMHKAHPSMAEFLCLYHRLKRKRRGPGLSLQSLIQTELNTFLKQREQVCLRVSRVVTKYRSILTYSSSSLVLRTAHLLSKKTHFFVTESRPIQEGRHLAAKLSRAGYRVTFGVDAMLGEFLKKADAVLLGCDALTDKTYIHKIGTRALVSLARQENIPVYVLVTNEKVIPRALAKTLRIVDKNPNEVWKKPPRGLWITNRYFEKNTQTRGSGDWPLTNTASYLLC